MKKVILLVWLLAPVVSVRAQEKKVLFVMSAAGALPLQNGKVYTQTGVFLSEFYLAYKAVVTQGYAVDFATPRGVVSSIDQESIKPKYWKGQEHLLPEAQAFVADHPSFRQPFTLEQALANAPQYAGIVVPGGQGLMVDLLYDSTMTQLLRTFARDEKCIGLICHAPALLLSLPPDENPLRGYRVNAVTGLEEWFIERFVMKGKPRVRKIGKQLKKNGFVYRKAGPAKNFAVRDRYLVTSQNPFSSEAFGKLYLEALQAYAANRVAE